MIPINYRGTHHQHPNYGYNQQPFDRAPNARHGLTLLRFDGERRRQTTLNRSWMYFFSPRDTINNLQYVIQRRGYGLRDEEYLRLKVLTCMLPEI